jgi:MIP family channel proteins
MYSLSRRALAEFIGTLALIFVGVGSILCNRMSDGAVSLLGIALAHGLTIAVMVCAFGHISGAHFNPAVTVGVLVARKISISDAAVYWIAQLAGGTIGALLLTGIFDPATREAAVFGTPRLFPGVTIGQGLLFETVATFFLVLVVCATAIDPRGAFSVVSGIPIGLVITFDILVGGPLTGAAMNPARTFGPAVVGGFWTNHWIYWVGPIAGGLIASLLYSSLYLKREMSA